MNCEMSAPGAVIFDLDGTLIDSILTVRAAVNWALEYGGLRALSLDEVKGLVGEGAHGLIEGALELQGIEATDARVDNYSNRFLSAYVRQPTEGTVVYPGVFETLEHLASEGTPMGICTNKPRLTTVLVLRTLDLIRYFSAVTCGDSPHPKPDGRHVKLTLDVMGEDIEGAVFVGDSETDMAAARDAGISAVGVTYGYSNGHPLDADALIDGMRDLPEALGAIMEAQ